MKYTFSNKIKATDFWLLSMHNTYHSLVGVCNIVFTIAMFLLAYRFMGRVNDILEVLIVLGCLLFTVIQPWFVYMRSKTQISMLPKDMELEFNDDGLKVRVGTESQFIPWKRIVGVTKSYNMIVIRSDARHGYFINNKMLGSEKDNFIEFIKSKIETNI